MKNTLKRIKNYKLISYILLCGCFIFCIPAYAGLSKKHLEWQQECIKKNNYTKPQRREEIPKLGISVEIPLNMDVWAGERVSSNESLTFAEINGIIEAKCNNIFEKLHGFFLPGRGISSISLEYENKLPGSNDTFADAVTILGTKRPIYFDRAEFWTTFATPGSTRILKVSSYDLGLTYFTSLLRSIRPIN